MRSVVSASVSRPPSLEAGIDEEWGDCTVFEEFGCLGLDNPQRTRAYLGYDARSLYFAFVMYEEKMAEIQTGHTKRTREIGAAPYTNEDDSIQVLIDPTRDGVHYCHVLVNPAGRWETLALRGTISVPLGADAVAVPRFGGGSGDELTLDLGTDASGQRTATCTII